MPRVGEIAEDGSSERGGGLSLHAGHYVLIDGHRERHTGVAEAFAYDLWVHVLSEKDGGVGVAEVV